MSSCSSAQDRTAHLTVLKQDQMLHYGINLDDSGFRVDCIWPGSDLASITVLAVRGPYSTATKVGARSPQAGTIPLHILAIFWLRLAVAGFGCA
jgi:hypothetical protein